MRWVAPAAYLLGIGWYFATCIVLGVVAGVKLDERLGTDPWLALIGTLLGLAAALYGGYRTLTDRVLKPPQSPGPPKGEP